MNKLSLLVVALLASSVVPVSAYWDDAAKKADAEKVVKQTAAKYDTAKADLGEIKAVENAKKSLARAKKSVVRAEAKLVEAKETGEGIERAEKRLENAKKSVVKHKARLREAETMEQAKY